jgi:hypothetical protein
MGTRSRKCSPSDSVLGYLDNPDYLSNVNQQRVVHMFSLVGYLDNPDYLSYVNKGDKYILHHLAT